MCWELPPALAWVSSGDALACAASLVELFATEDEPRFEAHAGLTPYEEWSVDAALADGDWCVLALKTDPGDYEFEDEDCRLGRMVRQMAWSGLQ